MNFAVTAMGRSGTRYLATVLNQSPTWSVEHEPHAGFQCVREVRERFADRTRYGEVNSYLRHQLLALDVTRAVIVRDPLEIFRSMYNRGRPRLDHLDEALRSIDELIRCGVFGISFRRMTGEPTYLRWIAYLLRVEDLPANLDLTCRNASATAPPMPPSLARRASQRLAWFAREYSELM